MANNIALPTSPQRLTTRILALAEAGNLYSLGQLDRYIRARGLGGDLKPFDVALGHLRRDLIPSVDIANGTDGGGSDDGGDDDDDDDDDNDNDNIIERALISLKLLHSLCDIACISDEISNEEAGNLILTRWDSILSWVNFLVTKWCPAEGRSLEDALKALQLSLAAFTGVFALGNQTRDHALANPGTIETIVSIYLYHGVEHSHFPFNFIGDPGLTQICILELLSTAISTPQSFNIFNQVVSDSALSQQFLPHFTRRRLEEMIDEAQRAPEDLSAILRACTSSSQIISRILTHPSLRRQLLDQNILRTFSRVLDTVADRCLTAEVEWDTVLRGAEDVFSAAVTSGVAVRNLENLLSGEFVKFLVSCITRNRLEGRDNPDMEVDSDAATDILDSDEEGMDDRVEIGEDGIEVDMCDSEVEPDEEEEGAVLEDEHDSIACRAASIVRSLAGFAVYTPISKVIQRSLMFFDIDDISTIASKAGAIRRPWLNLVENTERVVRHLLRGRSIGFVCDNTGHMRSNQPARFSTSPISCATCGARVYCSEECRAEDWDKFHRDECPSPVPEIGCPRLLLSMKADQLAFIEDFCNSNPAAIRFISSAPPHDGTRQVLGLDAIMSRVSFLHLPLPPNGHNNGRDRAPGGRARAVARSIGAPPTARLVLARFPVGLDDMVVIVSLQPRQGRYVVSSGAAVITDLELEGY